MDVSYPDLTDGNEKIVDEIIMSSVSIRILLFRQIYEVFFAVAGLSVPIFYSASADLRELPKWFSEWGWILFEVVMFYCAFITFLTIYEVSKTTKSSFERKMFLAIATVIANGGMIVLYCQLYLTAVAFWASYIAGPYALGPESYITHGGLFAVVFIYVNFLSVIRFGFWSCMASAYWTLFYYIFAMGRRLIIGEWVYIALDPRHFEY